MNNLTRKVTHLLLIAMLLSLVITGKYAHAASIDCNSGYQISDDKQ